MLASVSPKSFISGANVDLTEPMKLANSKEFHHIIPVKYLQRNGVERSKIYCLANFCFLNNTDNQKIKDKSPAKYYKLMSSACPPVPTSKRIFIRKKCILFKVLHKNQEVKCLRRGNQTKTI